MTIESRLAEIRARVENATEGPWSVYRGDRIGTYVTRPDLAGVAREWSLTWSDADAEFIAASRTDLPALLAAVEAVMKLHQPEPHCNNARHTNPDVGCPECAEFCTADEELYPCRTITALTAPLEAQDTTREDPS